MPKTCEDSIDTEALSKKYEAKDLPPFKVLRVQSVNHKPHIFMIGLNHVRFASEYRGGLLTNEVMRLVPCAHPGCHSRLHEHTYDVVLLLQLTRNTTNDECNKALQPIGAELEKDGIDGITLVETPEHYRVSK